MLVLNYSLKNVKDSTVSMPQVQSCRLSIDKLSMLMWKSLEKKPPKVLVEVTHLKLKNVLTVFQMLNQPILDILRKLLYFMGNCLVA